MQTPQTHTLNARQSRNRSRARPGGKGRKRRPEGPSFDETGHSRNYCQIAVDYAREIVADAAHERFGVWIYLGAVRFLKDLHRARGKRPPFTFSTWHANDPCDFIERLHHVKGTWDPPTIVLHPAHVLFIVQLFGFRRPNGRRRYTHALLNVPRKNAKSTISAGILLYCECCEEDESPEIISAATTLDQAEIIFKIAKRQVEKNPPLQQWYGLEVFSKSIVRSKSDGSFKAIHAKASTQDGLNPSAVGLDEIHAHKSPDLLNVLTSAAGGRENELWLFTTTEGYINAGPWAELRVFARQILNGVFHVREVDHYLVAIYAADEGDDEFAESTWRKANPLYDVNHVLREAVKKHATAAKGMPSAMGEFLIKRLNRQAAGANVWVDIPKWKRCAGRVDLKDLEGADCWAGLDLAATTDLTAWRLLWAKDGKWFTWGRRWVPADAAKSRTERGTAPFASWIQQGLIEEIEGDTVDYGLIERQILEDWERFQPKIVAYDPWNATSTALRLADAGVEMRQFIQGPKSYHPAMKALDLAYRSRALNHGGDEVLLWCMSNMIVRYDVNENMAPDKKRSPEKIDDATALLMAFGVAEGEQVTKKEYQLFFV